MIEMNGRRWLVAIAFGIGLSACGGSEEEAKECTNSDSISAVLEHAIVLPDGSAWAGLELSEDAEVVSLADALAAPAEIEGTTVRVTAKIDQVCQSSGCWMIVSDDGEETRVTFKDYGFFVPKDVAGRTVEMDVEVQRETMSVETARHLASETEGQDPEAITEPVETISVVATGVRILPASTEE